MIFMDFKTSCLFLEKSMIGLKENLEKAQQEKVQLTQQLNSSSIAPTAKKQNTLKMKQLEEKIQELNK